MVRLVIWDTIAPLWRHCNKWFHFQVWIQHSSSRIRLDDSSTSPNRSYDLLSHTQIKLQVRHLGYIFPEFAISQQSIAGTDWIWWKTTDRETQLHWLNRMIISFISLPHGYITMLPQFIPSHQICKLHALSNMMLFTACKHTAWQQLFV